MSGNSIQKKLNGAASIPAIMGASFFWTWLDQGMFGDALLLADDQAVAATAIVVMLLANIVSFITVYVIAGRQTKRSAWPQTSMIVMSCLGFLGGGLCLTSRIFGSTVLFIAGSILVGVSMAYQNLAWGMVAVSQGIGKASLHISGAWSVSLVINLLMTAFTPELRSLCVVVLPLLSLAGYLWEKKTESIERLEVVTRPEKVTGRKLRGYFGVDLKLLLIIVVFCGAFGFVYWIGSGLSLAAAGQDATSLALARGLVAVGFFVVCLLFSPSKLELLFRIVLSLLIAGVVVLTIGAFVPYMQAPGSVLVAMGYSGFDIFVWVLIAHYVRSPQRYVMQIIAVVILAQQVGILLGVTSGITLDYVGVDASSAGIVMAAINYLLLFACLALMKYSSVLATKDLPFETSLSSESNTAVGMFADAHGLTAREREITYLLGEGRNVPFIAEKLCVSENTVKSHVRHIYEKSHVHNRQELLDELEAIRTNEL